MKKITFQNESLDNPLVIKELASQIQSIAGNGSLFLIDGLKVKDELGTVDFTLAFFRVLLRASVLLQAPVYKSDYNPIEQYDFYMPDPLISSYGFFELRLFRGNNLLAKTEVFYAFDFVSNNWNFTPQDQALVQISYSLADKTIHFDYKLPALKESDEKCKHDFIQLRHLRTTGVSLHFTEVAQNDSPNSDEMDPLEMSTDEGISFTSDPSFIQILNLIQDVFCALLDLSHASPAEQVNQLQIALENIKYGRASEQYMDQYSGDEGVN